MSEPIWIKPGVGPRIERISELSATVSKAIVLDTKQVLENLKRVLEVSAKSNEVFKKAKDLQDGNRG